MYEQNQSQSPSEIQQHSEFKGQSSTHHAYCEQKRSEHPSALTARWKKRKRETERKIESRRISWKMFQRVDIVTFETSHTSSSLDAVDSSSRGQHHPRCPLTLFPFPSKPCLNHSSPKNRRNAYLGTESGRAALFRKRVMPASISQQDEIECSNKSTSNSFKMEAGYGATEFLGIENWEERLVEVNVWSY